MTWFALALVSFVNIDCGGICTLSIAAAEGGEVIEHSTTNNEAYMPVVTVVDDTTTDSIG